MKSLKLLKMIILSRKEKKARDIEFTKKMTVIIGKNKAGKSSLIKSIFYGLGCDVFFEKAWEELSPTIILKIEWNQKKFYIYRNKRTFKIFLENYELVDTFYSTRDFVEFCSKKMELDLFLNSKNEKLERAYPNQIFLPFYIDQDKGWKTILDSFKNLSQFKNPKKDIIAYYFNLIDNKINELKLEIEEIEKNIEKLIEKEEKYKELILMVFNEESKDEIEIDPEVLKIKIENLMKELEKEKGIFEGIRNNLFKNHKEKIELVNQKKALEKQLKKISKDFKFVSEQPEIIECPFCGHNHKNTFLNQLSIAEDEDEIREIINEIEETISKKDKELKKINQQIEEMSLKINNLENMIIKEKNNSYNLEKIFNAKGQEILLKKLEEKKSIIEKEEIVESKNKKEKEKEIKKIKKELKEKEKKRKEKYQTTFENNLRKLRVGSLNNIPLDNFVPSIKVSGSDNPRAILAYYYTINQIIEEQNCISIPFVIDSPKQQDPDKENEEIIMDFIKNNGLKKQVILGTVDCDFEEDENISLFKIEGERNLLKEELYIKYISLFNKFGDEKI